MTTKVKSVNVVEPPELSLLSEESVRKFREAHASYVMLVDKAARKEQHHCIPVNVARMVEILFTTAAKSNPSLKELSPEWMDDPPKKPVMNVFYLCKCNSDFVLSVIWISDDVYRKDFVFG